MTAISLPVMVTWSLHGLTKNWYADLPRSTWSLISAIAQPVLHDRPCGLGNDPLYYLQKHAFTIRHGGETSENLLKVYYLKERYPGLRLIINVNPIFCCPGLISEAIYKKVEKEVGIPIVSIIYDGTQADKNRVLNPYLYFLK